MATKTKPKDSRQPLTDRQRLVLKVIAKYLKDRGYSPSFREIMVGVDISSTNGIKGHLQALVRKGYLDIPVVNGRQVTRAMRVIE